jgi:hypothetical protein
MSIAVRIDGVGHLFVGLTRGEELAGHPNDPFTIGTDDDCGTSRRTRTGFPSDGASSCTPPLSVSTMYARFIRWTNST